MNIDIYKLKEDIESKIKKGFITSRILLGRSRFMDSTSTKSAPFNDPKYFPFYYQLGSHVHAKSLIQIGIDLGLQTACFVQGCPHVVDVLGMQKENGEFYSSRLAKGNIKDHFKNKLEIYVGDISDRDFLTRLNLHKWDVAIVTEESEYGWQRSCLELLWDSVKLGGLITIDYVNRHEPTRKAFEDFCLASNREPVVIDTRYGVGIVER